MKAYSENLQCKTYKQNQLETPITYLEHSKKKLNVACSRKIVDKMSELETKPDLACSVGVRFRRKTFETQKGCRYSSLKRGKTSSERKRGSLKR